MEMRSWSDCWDQEKKAREKIDPDKICEFGIRPLDDALIGILRNDLVVIGADSGVGKSELILNMAITNAEKGRRVAVFFIEGGADEAIARIKWNEIKREFYKNYVGQGISIDYRKWRMNKDQPPLIKEIEEKVKIAFWDKVGDRLDIYDFRKEFTITELITSLGWYVPTESFITHPNQLMFDVDLIIIDHLQYFTLTNPRNELEEMTNILKKIKEITIFDNIPVVLISHLRKKDKDRGLPSQDDFYGTSNIAKISSVAITIASKYSEDDYANNLYPTFFRIVKSRTGIRQSLAMRCCFDAKQGLYQNTYTTYRLNGDNPFEIALEQSKVPDWAKDQTTPK